MREQKSIDATVVLATANKLIAYNTTQQILRSGVTTPSPQGGYILHSTYVY